MTLYWFRPMSSTEPADVSAIDGRLGVRRGDGRPRRGPDLHPVGASRQPGKQVFAVGIGDTLRQQPMG